LIYSYDNGNAHDYRETTVFELKSDTGIIAADLRSALIEHYYIIFDNNEYNRDRESYFRVRATSSEMTSPGIDAKHIFCLLGEEGMTLYDELKDMYEYGPYGQYDEHLYPHLYDYSKDYDAQGNRIYPHAPPLLNEEA
jgi:hypothetical protein